ncbi:MAG: YHS domain-containing (seleno)protein [Pseudomonadota bacterium]
MLTRRTLLAAPAVLLLPRAALAASEPEIYSEGGIAIDGTDPTGYFTASTPVAGDPAITLDWKGTTWRFASAEARTLFESNPDAYAPQFGGYCAWAVAEGYTASTIPEAWKIVDGKLYLNFNRRIQRRWERDIPGNIARGEANWPNVLTA